VVERVFVVEGGAGPISGLVRGEGRDVLLLHGGPGLSDYMGLVEGETGGWRATRYQQRGLPPSTIEGPYSVARHVADAVAVLDTMEVAQAVLLGHSWGGHLALQLALARPDRVSAVVVVDALGSVGDGGAPALGQELRRRLPPQDLTRCEEIDRRLAEPGAGDADVLASLALLWPSYFAEPAKAPPMPGELRLSLACAGGTFASVMDELADGNFAHRLQQLDVPVVVVLGEASPMPLDVGKETAALIPRSETVVVPRAGHLPWHEQPGCLSQVLERVAVLG
jgi:pimeloyl-ACP methyl ester carboxylesterase